MAYQPEPAAAAEAHTGSVGELATPPWRRKRIGVGAVAANGNNAAEIFRLEAFAVGDGLQVLVDLFAAGAKIGEVDRTLHEVVVELRIQTESRVRQVEVPGGLCSGLAGRAFEPCFIADRRRRNRAVGLLVAFPCYVAIAHDCYGHFGVGHHAFRRLGTEAIVP